MTLVTIICEALARHAVTRAIQASGAHGYTLFPVEGRGSAGERPGDIQEFGNIQVEVIVPPSAADRLLLSLQTEVMPLFALVVHASDIRVLRRDKF